MIYIYVFLFSALQKQSPIQYSDRTVHPRSPEDTEA